MFRYFIITAERGDRTCSPACFHLACWIKNMNKILRSALLVSALALSSGAAFAANVSTAPAPSQDPIVQHLKLSQDQVTKIQQLHQQLKTNIQQIKITGAKDGAIIDMIRSGKWSDDTVKTQLTAFGNAEQQARYYKVKYYFDLNQILTPAQRQQVQDDLAKAAME